MWSSTTSAIRPATPPRTPAIICMIRSHSAHAREQLLLLSDGMHHGAYIGYPPILCQTHQASGSSPGSMNAFGKKGDPPGGTTGRGGCGTGGMRRPCRHEAHRG